MSDDHAVRFAEHRPALVGAAYRVLGSVHDAEDVVQEAWLRWSDVDLSTVREPRAYLVRTTTRLALNRVRQQSRRREEYVGPWLPEPLTSTEPGGEEAAELAESVSMAMLVVLANLSPLERAAFVLKEVFDLPYTEIATTLDRSSSSVRQLAHRAREHVHARAPRNPVDDATHRRVTEKFWEATSTGALEDLVAMMSPEVVLVSDGGGKKRAALRPIHGPDKILRWLAGVLARPEVQGLDLRLAEVNGRAGLVGIVDGAVDAVGILELDEGVVSEVYLVRNPDKLGHIRVPQR